MWPYKDDQNESLIMNQWSEYESLKYKIKITVETPDDGSKKGAEIAVSLRLALRNFGELLRYHKSIVKLISF